MFASVQRIKKSPKTLKRRLSLFKAVLIQAKQVLCLSLQIQTYIKEKKTFIKCGSMWFLHVSSKGGFLFCIFVTL